MFKNEFAPIKLEKVGRVIRRRLLFLSFLLLLTFNMLVVLNLNTIGVSADEPPYIAVVPSSVTDISLTPGESFTVSIYTDYNESDVNGWQFTLSYNPHVLHGLSVTNGDLITKDKDSSAIFIPGTFDNTAGILTLTSAVFRYTGKLPVFITEGPGTLANVTFEVVGTGDSPITLGDETILFGYTEGGYGKQYNIINAATDRDQIQHGYFCNTAEPPIHDVAVFSVTPNETEVISSELVDIAVVVENQGTVVETFDVSLYYDIYSLIGKTTGVTLNGSDSTSLTYTWDTTYVTAATHFFRAVASIVWGETDTEDNTLIPPDTVTVLALPQASFTYSPSEPIAGKTVTFDASTSDDLDGSIVSYGWDFGDDTNATLADPVVTHNYMAFGTYTVNLTVTDDDDLTDTATGNITVLAHDIAVTSVTASPIAGMPGDLVTINVTLVNRGDFNETFNITAYYDNTAIGTQNVTNLAPLNETTLTFTWDTTDVLLGIYTIKAVANVTDDYNLTNNEFIDGTVSMIRDIAVIEITVFPKTAMPGIVVNVNVTVANLGTGTETFDVSTYANETLIETKLGITPVAGGTEILTFTWNTAGLSEGEYTIKANATILPEEYNTTNNELMYSTVSIKPYNYFSFEKSVGGVTFYVHINTTSSVSNLTYSSADKKISFNATAVPGLEGLPAWWNVKIPKALLDDNFTVLIDGDEVAFTPTSNATHTFLYFNHTLSSRRIQIKGAIAATPPVASFTPSKTEAFVNEPITFNASASHDLDGQIVSYEWDFGDDNVTTVDYPVISHVYTLAENKTYQIRLTVTDNHTIPLKHTYYKNVTITALKPVANFTPSKTEAFVREPITFNASASYDPDLGSIVSYKWNFGDETPIVTEPDPITTHNYTAAGLYTVTLTVTDNQNLTGTDTQQVTIEKLSSTITISASPTTLLAGETTTISGPITPPRPRANVTIWYWPEGQETWKTILKEVTTDDNGQYSYVWTPLMPGIYELRATWEGDETAFNATSNVITIEVDAPPLLSPYIGVVPYSTVNPNLTIGTTYTVSIYTDYDGSDIYFYYFNLSYNPDVLRGGINNTDTWAGDGTTTFSTTGIPVVPGSEVIYVNGTLMTVETAGYDIWTGDNVTKKFNLTGKLVVPDSDAVYVNGTLLTRYTAANDTWTGDGVTTIFSTTHTPLVKETEPLPGHGIYIYVNGSFQTEYIDYIVNYPEGKINFTLTATDRWVIAADNATNLFDTTRKPVVLDSEKIYVNQVLMTRSENYTIDYDTGQITFAFVPSVGAEIRATYQHPPGVGAEIEASYRYGHYIVYYALAEKPYSDYPEGEIKFFTAPADGVEIEVTYMYYQYATNYEEGEITFTFAPSVGAEIKAMYLYGGLANGDVIVGGTAEFILGDFDNTAGTLSPTSGFFFYIFPPPAVASGPGILANVTFTVVGTGASNIILGKQTQLIGWNFTIDDIYNIVDAETMPYHIQHGYFDNTKAVHDVAVISIEAPAEADVGDIVSINVTVTNQGSFPENFNVTAYANTTKIGTQLVTLSSQRLDYISFKWNTTGLSPGTYTLRAEAILDRDSDPRDNLYSKSIVVRLLLGIIEGTVTDSSTGDPIEGATVTANGYSNITDAEGRYSIEVPPGTYNVTASATKYVSQSKTATVTSNTNPTLDFALTPLNGTISGRVTDSSTGDPISGATVTINGISVSTGTDGTYSIELPPGTYTVTVSMDGYDDSSNTDITVVSEEMTPVNFELTPIQPLNILLYAGVAAIAIIVVAAIAVYFLKVRKPT